MSGSNVIAQLSADWRIVIISGNTWRRPTWMIQERLDDAWRDKAAIRTREGLRALVQSYVGPVGADAADILAALPERVDLHPRPTRDFGT